MKMVNIPAARAKLRNNAALRVDPLALANERILIPKTGNTHGITFNIMPAIKPNKIAKSKFMVCVCSTGS